MQEVCRRCGAACDGLRLLSLAALSCGLGPWLLRRGLRGRGGGRRDNCRLQSAGRTRRRASGEECWDLSFKRLAIYRDLVFEGSATCLAEACLCMLHAGAWQMRRPVPAASCRTNLAELCSVLDGFLIRCQLLVYPWTSVYYPPL